MVSNGRVETQEAKPAPYDGQDWVPLYLVSLMLVILLLVIGAIGHVGTSSGTAPARPHHRPSVPATSGPVPVTPPTAPATPDARPGASLPAYPDDLPGGVTHVFGPGRMLVAYYGTAGTGSLGVLGDASPDAIMPRLDRAARAFAVGGRTVQPVFELIVTVAHIGATRTGDYSADIDHALVRSYIEAAHRHGALVVLDLQPGRASFPVIARRWAWALADPWVGLALDPEWRMGPHGVPGRRIGSVGAAEINETSRWLDDFTASHGLPQKIFLLHQFRTDMIRDIGRVLPRAHLAMVQHVDGFGPPRTKLATFHAVVRPGRFVLGFKLFYRQDVPRMRPAQVFRIRPRIQFVSFQ
ncbi:MAG: hypothetical protein JWR52_1044 [Marmoricola sp.]|nr:hypothetical protein [Marmoricola sp.]